MSSRYSLWGAWLLVFLLVSSLGLNIVNGNTSSSVVLYPGSEQASASSLTVVAPSVAEPGCKGADDRIVTAPCGNDCNRADVCGGPVSGGRDVYLFSGEVFESAIDLRIAGRGQDFVWARKYRSRTAADAGMGHGWDFSYNIRIVTIDVGNAPGEVQDLQFTNKETLVWNPPADPGAPPALLRYCTLRSTDPSDFANPGTTSIIDLEGVDRMTTDSDVPALGGLFTYLGSAKNGFGEGPLGVQSDSTPRVGLPCGDPGPTLSLLVFDGNTRADAYGQQADGTWTTPEFFREISQNPDGSFTLTFPDTGTWNFHPLDGSPEEGKFESIVDRNGNTLSAAYDGSGRLDTVTDTLGRVNTVGYNADGFVGLVTDFTGRQVVYDYYDGIEPGGAFGDLKSVTTPAVTGTSNGNDFPGGKTTLYTYSTGFADEFLNHNLLTITDPKGQTFLTNVFSGELDPGQLDYDRVVRQIHGDPGDIIDYVYVPQVPGASNNFSVIQTITNDAVGNVEASFFDAGNRNVVMREYTGRWDPDQPTSALDLQSPPPTAKLRGDDPPLFETRWSYNADSLETGTIDANQNSTVSTFDTSNASRRSQGNLLQHCRVAGPLGGDQVQICESYEYDDGSAPITLQAGVESALAGCCGTNFVTREVDGRGNETLHQYDSVGNRTQTQHRIPSIIENFEYNAFGQMTARVLPDNGSAHRRRDEYTYYSTGPQRGYLQSKTVDAPGFALTTTFEYDALGRVVRFVDPRGHDKLYEWNALDQVVKETSREVEDGSGVRYETSAYYDANDNVVRVDVQNIDDQGVLRANTHFTMVYEYDVLNYRVVRCTESGNYTGVIPGSAVLPSCTGLPGIEFITEDYQYDENRNRVLTRYGEATNGNQPTNLMQTLYDERDLVLHEVRASGDTDQSTTQYDYDPNKNQKRVHEGLEDTPRVTSMVYDGYDRWISATDPMGNVSARFYDANDNVTSQRTDGQLTDVAGGAGNVRLSESDYDYDAMDRQTLRTVEFFDADTQTPIMGGQQPGLVISEITYSDNSQVTLVTNDNLHATSVIYDTANRALTTTDAKTNTFTNAYDANSNVTSIVEVEKSDLGSLDQSFTTSYVYDNLDRLTSVSDNFPNTSQYAYDSRNNKTLQTDALGNMVRTAYDGINRVTTTIRDLDSDGADGDGPDITTTQAWDDTSRLVGRTDDSNNTSSYVYDALSRLTAEQYADNTVESYVFDVHDNTTLMTDANGSMIASTYDLLDRLTGKTVAPGPGVSSDTTSETYKYDGLERLVHVEDNDSLVTLSYDSLSNVIRETLNGQTTTSLYDGVNNQLICTYPGARVVTNAYDELERKKMISDGVGTTATYDYVGPGRVERREYGNGTRTSYQYDGITGVSNPMNDFGVKRIISTTHSVISGGAIIDGRSYTWDRMYNKTQRKDVRSGGPQLTHEYAYDAIYRLTHTTVSDAVVVRDTDYTLDGVGNRTTVVGSPDPGPYSMDPTLPDPADNQMNQYTSTPFDARTYDANGNLSARAGLATILYDYRNQMVEYTSISTGERHTYAYDALGRRTVRIVDADGAADQTRYFYDGSQVVEEQDGTSATQATYVYGPYIDEVLNMQRSASGYYYHADDLHNVVAITDAAGSVTERHEYADYGQPINPTTLAPIAGDPSGIGNPYLFTGRRFDPETGWFYYRTRYLDPAAGRFTTRDSIGIWGDSSNLGNGYGYVGSSPSTYRDPFGMEDDFNNLEKGGIFVLVIGGGALTCATSVVWAPAAGIGCIAVGTAYWLWGDDVIIDDGPPEEPLTTTIPRRPKGYRGIRIRFVDESDELNAPVFVDPPDPEIPDDSDEEWEVTRWESEVADLESGPNEDDIGDEGDDMPEDFEGKLPR